MFKRKKPNELSTDGPDAPLLDSAAPEAVEKPAEPALEPAPTAEVPPVQATDSGLGVPPFRPAPIKDALPMSRPPFPPVTPAAPPAPLPSVTPRPTGPATNRVAARDPAERRTLVVGRGISVQGTVQDAERLVVEGTVEASMIRATELSIAPGGIFKGEVEVEDAEIAGTIDGTLTAKASLVVRASGRVLGTARCRRLQVEDGGQITGRIEMITEPMPTDTSSVPTSDPVA